MVKKILVALDDGHGTTTAGKRTPTLPNGQKSELGLSYMNENLFNRAVVKYLKQELIRNGFDILEVAPTDVDTPLYNRTTLANQKKADIYLSIHANALTGNFGSWGGIETFHSGRAESLKLAKAVHKELLKGTPLADRGTKDGSHLWVIRKTNMPAILIEAGFMDSHKDYKYLLSDAYRRECAREICMGVCEYFGREYKSEVIEVSAPINKDLGDRPKSHVVEKGETFYSIAQKYDMSVKLLLEYNARVEADELRIGDVIHLIPFPTAKG